MDLVCDPHQIELHAVRYPYHWVARGCGRQATYAWSDAIDDFVRKVSANIVDCRATSSSAACKIK